MVRRTTTPFQEQVYEICRKIPAGKVTTYKALTEQLGIRCPQAIGQALKNNPYAPIVPCHRVVKSTGELGGFKGQRQGEVIKEKSMMLQREGVVVVQNKVDLKRYGFWFS